MTYFFKNDLYYRFNSSTATVDTGYPKKIDQYWFDIPQNVQAAFTSYNGGVYFFKDSKYWHFVPGQNSIDIAYPKSVENWWTAHEQKYQDYNAFRWVHQKNMRFCGKGSFAHKRLRYFLGYK